MSDSLADTITPKSDQLNADDLLVGPITVTVKAVKRGDKDQPVVLDIDGGRMPYKPCKSMRRVLIAAWGDRGADWVGRSMTLYCDPNVVFGGVKVGGIRISHLSHIERDRDFMLTTSRSKRTESHVKRLTDEKPNPETNMLQTVLDSVAKVTDHKKLGPIAQRVQQRFDEGALTKEEHEAAMAAIVARETELIQTTDEPPADES